MDAKERAARRAAQRTLRTAIYKAIDDADSLPVLDIKKALDSVETVPCKRCSGTGIWRNLTRSGDCWGCADGRRPAPGADSASFAAICASYRASRQGFLRARYSDALSDARNSGLPEDDRVYQKIKRELEHF